MYQRPPLEDRLKWAKESIDQCWQDILILDEPVTDNEIEMTNLFNKLVATLKLMEDALSGEPDIKLCNDIAKNLIIDEMPVRVDCMTRRECLRFDNLVEVSTTIRFIEGELDEE